MQRVQSKALFLHRFPALASGVTPIVLLTEELGLVRALVKGLQNPKSKLASRMDPLLALEVELLQMSSGNYLLTGASVSRRFADHSLSYERIQALWQVWGAVHSLLLEDDVQSEIFEELFAFLELLPSVKAPQVLADMTLLKVLTALGQMHIHEHCLHCDQDLRSCDTVWIRTEDMLTLDTACTKKLSTAVGLTELPHLVYKTLLLYQLKSLQLAEMVSIPEEVAKKAHEVVMERLQMVQQ